MGNTIPGGYYLDAQTNRHVDAWGKPVDKQSDSALKKAKEETETLTPDQAELLRSEDQTRRAAEEARQAADVAEEQAKAATVRKSGSKKSAKSGARKSAKRSGSRKAAKRAPATEGGAEPSGF